MDLKIASPYWFLFQSKGTWANSGVDISLDNLTLSGMKKAPAPSMNQLQGGASPVIQPQPAMAQPGNGERQAIWLPFAAWLGGDNFQSDLIVLKEQTSCVVCVSLCSTSMFAVSVAWCLCCAGH